MHARGRKSPRMRVPTTNALPAPNPLQASFTSLPTEIKEMIVCEVGSHLERGPGAWSTKKTRLTLKSLCRMDKTYASLAQPYLFQAVTCRGITNEGLLYFHNELLPRFRNNITSLLFERTGSAESPTVEMRKVVGDTTGTSQDDHDGEEMFSALIRIIIFQLVNLTAVAFDFHSTAPRDSWPTRGDTFEYLHLSDDVLETLRNRKRKPPPGFNQDVVLGPLIALSSQITSLDINIDSCPPRDYGILATFLSSFPNLETLRLADPPESRSPARNAGSGDVLPKLLLLHTINEMEHLENLALLDLGDLLDGNLALIPWTIALKSLIVKGADDVPVEAFMDFIEAFGESLETLTLSECPRRPLDPYMDEGAESDDEEIDDEAALEDRELDLPNLKALTLGIQFIPAVNLSTLFSSSPLESLTIGACHHFTPEDCYDFAEQYESTMKNLRVRVHQDWTDDEAEQLKRDLRVNLDMECRLSWRREFDDEDEPDWPKEMLYA
ncbi:hypothetical protein P7C70_g2190, partial [Phenoliferia sp. Uapishka_3]